MNIIAVMGSGISKSVIAANLAVLLAKGGKRTVILDGNFVLSRIDTLLGLNPKTNIAKFFCIKDTKLRKIIAEGPYGLKLIPASNGLMRLNKIEPEQMTDFIGSLKELERDTDYLIIDCESGLTTLAWELQRLASQILIVTKPETVAMTNAYAIARNLIAERKRLDIQIIINNFRPHENGQAIFDQANSAIEKITGRRVSLAGIVRSDPYIPDSVARQKPVVGNEFPASIAAGDLRDIAFNLWRLVDANGDQIRIRSPLNDWVN
jgi:flagellar biosynthesis protein FlhG